MGLTQEKAELLHDMNERATAEWTKARDKAVQEGRPLPAPPVPLKPEDLEYPKFIYKEGQSKLVQDAAEHKAAGAGWSEAPPEKKKE